MHKSSLVYGILLGVAFVLGVLWGQNAWMTSASAQPPPAPLADVAPRNPVVAATVQAYTSENEEDPFNPERVRRSRTTVNSIVLVRADGKTEVQKVGGR